MQIVQNDMTITSYAIYHAVELFRVEMKNIELLIPYVLDSIDAVCIEPDRTRLFINIAPLGWCSHMAIGGGGEGGIIPLLSLFQKFTIKRFLELNN